MARLHGASHLRSYAAPSVSHNSQRTHCCCQRCEVWLATSIRVRSVRRVLRGAWTNPPGALAAADSARQRRMPRSVCSAGAACRLRPQMEEWDGGRLLSLCRLLRFCCVVSVSSSAASVASHAQRRRRGGGMRRAAPTMHRRVTDDSSGVCSVCSRSRSPCVGVFFLCARPFSPPRRRRSEGKTHEKQNNTKHRKRRE